MIAVSLIRAVGMTYVGSCTEFARKKGITIQR